MAEFSGKRAFFCVQIIFLQGGMYWLRGSDWGQTPFVRYFIDS